MKQLIISFAVLFIVVAGATAETVPTSDDVLGASDSDQSGLRKVFSDKPFFGTQSVLTLNGSYMNTPYDDLQQTGKWDLPLTLDQMDGVVGELSFGDGVKEGEWQLSYRYKLMNMDSEWQAVAVANSELALADRHSQMLKASYNIRSWWKLGLAAVVEDRPGTDLTTDPSLLGTTGHGSLGFQIDTSLKF